MKTYAVRKQLRTPVCVEFCYFCDGALTDGTVWDLSETGWRATGKRPVSVGTETTVYITLRDRKGTHNILIDSAMVRWSRGRDAGWEITRMDDSHRMRLMNFIEHFLGEDEPQDATAKTAEIEWY